MMSNVNAIAESFLGIRFREIGRDCATGLDCVGLVIQFWRARGVDLKCPLSYTTADFEQGYFRDQLEMVVEPADGDIVRMGERHLGIRVGRMTLHVDERMGVVMQRIPRATITGYYRPKL